MSFHWKVLTVLLTGAAWLILVLATYCVSGSRSWKDGDYANLAFLIVSLATLALAGLALYSEWVDSH